MSKIKISFNERGYKKATQAHNEHNVAKVELTKVIEGLGLDKNLVKEEKIYVSTVEALYDKLSEGSTLPASINKLKFLELMDVNLVPLSQAVNKYINLAKFASKPKKVDFEQYAEGKDVERISEIVDFLNKNLDLIPNRGAIQNAFAQRIGIDTGTFNFKINA